MRPTRVAWAQLCLFRCPYGEGCGYRTQGTEPGSSFRFWTAWDDRVGAPSDRDSTAGIKCERTILALYFCTLAPYFGAIITNWVVGRADCASRGANMAALGIACSLAVAVAPLLGSRVGQVSATSMLRGTCLLLGTVTWLGFWLLSRREAHTWPASITKMRPGDGAVATALLPADARPDPYRQDIGGSLTPRNPPPMLRYQENPRIIRRPTYT